MKNKRYDMPFGLLNFLSPKQRETGKFNIRKRQLKDFNFLAPKQKETEKFNIRKRQLKYFNFLAKAIERRQLIFRRGGNKIKKNKGN